MLDLFQGARLTPTQRRIAQSLVQHAPSAAYLSAAEVAELAGVSQPSVTRFAMALGYAGYPALRRELRTLVGVEATPVASGDNPVQRALRAETQRMERMIRDLLDYASIDAGTFSIHTRAQDVHSILAESLAGFEAIAVASTGVLISISP